MKKKLNLLVLLLFSVFLLSACGADIDDRMSINSDFQGHRVMNITVKADNFMGIGGGLTGLSNFLRTEVKEPLRLEILTETNNLIEANIYLDFTDLNDYKAKVEALYKQGGIPESIEIDFTSSKDNVFLQGLKFTDNTEAKYLLYHLLDKAIEQNIVKKSDTDKVWNSTKYSLIYNKKNVLNNLSSPPYTLDSFTYLGPDYYVLTTSPSADNKWTRVYNMGFAREKLSKLESTWERKLIKDPAVEKLESREVEDQAGNVFINYSYALEGQDLTSISKLTNSLLQKDGNLNLSFGPNTSDFTIDLKIEEDIPQIDLDDLFKVTSIYYSNPLTPSEHLIVGPEVFSGEFDASDAIFVDQDLLAEGFTETLKIKPSFPSAKIETKLLLDGSLERKIDIEKSAGTFAKYSNDLILKYLDENKLTSFVDEKVISIKYAGDKFEEKNKLLFEKNPQVNFKNSLFMYNIEFKEDTRFSKLDVQKLSQNIVGPKLSRRVEDKMSFSDGNLDNNILIRGPKPVNIALAILVGLILLITLIILIRSIIKERKLNKEKTEQKVN